MFIYRARARARAGRPGVSQGRFCHRRGLEDQASYGVGRAWRETRTLGPCLEGSVHDTSEGLDDRAWVTCTVGEAGGQQFSRALEEREQARRR